MGEDFEQLLFAPNPRGNVDDKGGRVAKVRWHIDIFEWQGTVRRRPLFPVPCTVLFASFTLHHLSLIHSLKRRIMVRSVVGLSILANDDSLRPRTGKPRRQMDILPVMTRGLSRQAPLAVLERRPVVGKTQELAGLDPCQGSRQIDIPP